MSPEPAPRAGAGFASAVLPIALAVQAALLLWRLSLLDPWFDEADTLLFMKGPLAQAIAIPASGLHPPLYFFLLYGWMRIPLGLAWTIQARLLSVIFALAATVVADRLWAWRLGRNGRRWFLALWVTSPCLLLYCRMARSYSLQLLLGTLSAGLILQVLEKPTRRATAALAATLAALLYVHYVPAAAMLAATALALTLAHRWRRAAVVCGSAVAAFVPWMPKLLWSLGQWGAHRQAYSLSGSRLAEVAVKVAYWAMSFWIGETFPDWLLPLGIVLAAIAIFAGFRLRPTAPAGFWWIAIPAALVGFIGVMRWVSYPFIPARMMFLFALFLTLVVANSRRWLAGALLALSICGIWCYFNLIGFRNKQYPMRMGEIAAKIRAGGDGLVLADSTNSDPIGLRYALWPDRPVLETGEPDARDKVAAALADAKVRTVWFLRNTHDVSPNALDAQFQSQLAAAGMRARVWSYEPYTPLERSMLRAMGMAQPPADFSELLEFRR